MMSAYIHGSLAMDEKVKPGQTVKVREIKRKVYRTRSIPMQEKLLYLFTVALCVIVAGVIIWRYSQIYEMNTKIHNIEVAITKLQNENDTLKQKLNKANDPNTLKKDAEKNGLSQVDPDKITHVPGKPAFSSSNDNKVAFKQ